MVYNVLVGASKSFSGLSKTTLVPVQLLPAALLLCQLLLGTGQGQNPCWNQLP